jgi:molybdopterin synthase catalytic subunit
MPDRLEVVHAPLAPAELKAAIRTDACGAVACFVGTVRSPNRGQVVHYLEYEGYEAMIVAEMERIADELKHAFGVHAVALAHRLGRLAVGEASIVVAAASPHRGPALATVERGIDLCKERLPVWKREVTAAGAVWVEGTAGAGPVL